MPEERRARLAAAIERARANLRAQPASVSAHGALARALERAKRLDEALDHRRRAVELAPGDQAALRSLGEILLRSGRFADARTVFARCCARDPDDQISAFSLSSLERHRGETFRARQLVELAVGRRALTRPRPLDPAKPTILRIRSLDRSYFGLVKRADGSYRSLLRGGHFSVANLVPRGCYNLLILNVLGDNLSRLGALPRFDLMLNTIGCADRAGVSLRRLEGFVQRFSDVPLVNPPALVTRTTRDGNYERLSALDGLVFPRTWRFGYDGGSPREAVERIAAAGFDFPLILRTVGSQTGNSLLRAETPNEAEAYFTAERAGHEHFAIAYRDCRGPDGRYRKLRVFCIDGRFHPAQCIVSEGWNIHSRDRYGFMETSPSAQGEEASFLDDPWTYLGPEGAARLERIRALVGLDFFGMDFTLLEDGRLFVFELNPAMRHNFDHLARFPYTRPYLQEITRAFERMLRRKLARRP